MRGLRVRVLVNDSEGVRVRVSNGTRITGYDSHQGGALRGVRTARVRG